MKKLIEVKIYQVDTTSVTLPKKNVPGVKCHLNCGLKNKSLSFYGFIFKGRMKRKMIIINFLLVIFYFIRFAIKKTEKNKKGS